MSFTVYPAIDLKGGNCVRLLQGRAEDVTVYSSSPVEMAEYWVSEGARWLHKVDLDGAFDGKPAHTEVIGKVVIGSVKGGNRSRAWCASNFSSGRAIRRPAMTWGRSMPVIPEGLVQAASA